MPISSTDYLIEFSKRIFHKLGLIELFKLFKRNKSVETIE